MKRIILVVLTMATLLPVSAGEYLKAAKELVILAKQRQPADAIIEQLAQANLADLKAELNTDNKKLAFWINVYNGFVQHLLTDNPALFEDRNAFFTNERIVIAGQSMSLDDVEHGMIRGSKIKLSMGLLGDPFPGSFEKDLRVENLNPRIHFALNCGAKSCPYVAVYDYEKIQEQLDASARQFLQRTSRFDAGANKVYVSTLFSWFRGDFGGKDGTLKMLRQYEIIPEDASPDIVYKEYDWTLSLHNYKEL